MGGHEDAGSARRAHTPQPRDLAVAVHLVVLEGRKLDLLVLVLNLLRLRVDLLLALLRTALEAARQVDGGLPHPPVQDDPHRFLRRGRT